MIMGMGSSSDDALWLGVELADGRKATNAGGRPPEVDWSPEAMALARVGGNSRECRHTFVLPFTSPATWGVDDGAGVAGAGHQGVDGAHRR